MLASSLFSIETGLSTIRHVPEDLAGAFQHQASSIIHPDGSIRHALTAGPHHGLSKRKGLQG